MVKTQKKNKINREITFPIKVDGNIITASPGDSVASALYANNKKSSNIINFNKIRKFIFTKNNKDFFSIGHNEIELGFDIIFDQQAYPGLELNSYYFSKFLSHETFFKSTAINFLSFNKLINFVFKKNNFYQLNFKNNDDFEVVSTQVLIVGAGVAGLLASSILVKTGIKVILLERDFILGGYLGYYSKHYRDWINKTIDDLVKNPNCTILTNTNLIYSDRGKFFFALKKAYTSNQNNSIDDTNTLLKIVSDHAIIATGLKERSIQNLKIDKPNIMLASKVFQIVNRFGLSIPDGVVIYTNNDFGWNTAYYLLSLGVKIKAVIDTRISCKFSSPCTVYRGAKIIKTYGYSNLKFLKVLDAQGRKIKIKTSFLIISGGFDLNLGSVEGIIESLIWCNDNLTFIPDEYVKNIDIVNICDDIFCTDSLIKKTSEVVSKILKKNKSVNINKIFPITKKQSLNAELVQNFNNYTNLEKGYFHHIFDGFFKKNLENKESLIKMKSRLNYLKLNALDGISNDRIIKNVIKNNIIFKDDVCTKLCVSVFNEDKLSQNIIDGKFNSPYRVLGCHEFYKGIGCEIQNYSGWLIPKIFNKDNSKIDVNKNTNNENLFNNTVGITDQSDFAKITIVGKDALSFLKNILDLNENEFKEKSFFSYYLVNYDEKSFNNLLILKINSENFLILLDPQNENAFYNFLNSNLQTKYNRFECNIYLESEIFQVFTLLGSYAFKIIENKFNINRSNFTKKNESRIYIFSYSEQTIVLFFRVIRSQSFFSIIIDTNYSEQLLRDFHLDIKRLNGGFIGRDAFDKIKLECGYLSSIKLKNLEIFEHIFSNTKQICKEIKTRQKKYKLYQQNLIYSKIICLFPKGLTKNIVNGSEVYSFKNGKKQSLIGEVLTSFYSSKKGTMLAFMVPVKQNITLDLVIVENLNKNYKTICEAKKYDDCFLYNKNQN